MKTLYLFVVLTAASLSAQQLPLTNANLVGKYEFLDIQDDTKKPDDIKERKALMEGMAIVLNADGTCVTSFIMDLDGKWTLDAAKKIITVVDRKENIWYIHSLTKEQAILSRNQTDFKIIFARK